jgi:hypothetical protein
MAGPARRLESSQGLTRRKTSFRSETAPIECAEKAFAVNVVKVNINHRWPRVRVLKVKRGDLSRWRSSGYHAQPPAKHQVLAWLSPSAGALTFPSTTSAWQGVHSETVHGQKGRIHESVTVPLPPRMAKCSFLV